jgi:hypothetical protein
VTQNQALGARVTLQKLAALMIGGAFVLFFARQGLAFIGANSQTFDEAAHLAAGYSHLARQDFRLNAEDPPLIKELTALPLYLAYRLPFDPDPALWQDAEEWQIGRNFLYRSPIPHEQLLAAGRVPNLLLGALLVGLTGWWAYRLWGCGAAVAATGLAALDPNLVAHASVITSDLGLALFTFLTLYLLWEYLAAPSRGRLLAVGVSLGLALATKYSALLLVGIVAAVLGLHALKPGAFPPEHGQTNQGDAPGARLARATIPGRRILICALLTVPLFYFLHGCLMWSVGLRTQLDRPDTPVFFFGGSHAWPRAGFTFPVVFLLKTPVGTLLMLLASLVLFRAGRRWGRHEALFLLLPPVLFVAAMAAARVSNNLRYVLPIYPFLFVAASRVATIRWPAGLSWGGPALLLGLPLALTGFSSAAMAPHQLAYFNELAGGPEEGYRYLGDSNLDWGQDLHGLHSYLEREGVPMIYFSYFGTAPPRAYGIRYQFLPSYVALFQEPPADRMPDNPGRELLAISVGNLQGTFLRDSTLYHWLYQRTPVAKIGYSIYVYDLTGDAEAHRHLGEVYRKVGLDDYAGLESEKAARLCTQGGR